MTTYYAKTASENPDAFCHFFIDDYRYERIWNHPERYVEVVKKYAGAIMPNFSTYHIMPLPMQYWNLYRNRALAYYWQQEGVDVIPLLQCGDPRTYDYAFEGLPIGGTYAVMNNGVMQDKENRQFFYEGLMVGVQAVKPDLLVCYGTEVDLSALPCEVVWYKNDNTARVRANVLPPKSEEPQLDLTGRESKFDGDGTPRAISVLGREKRNPLMYNDELEGWEPFYVRELGYALPGTNPPMGKGIQMSKEALSLMDANE